MNGKGTVIVSLSHRARHNLLTEFLAFIQCMPARSTALISLNKFSTQGQLLNNKKVTLQCPDMPDSVEIMFRLDALLEDL